MEASGKGLLKVTGILMIVFGGISVLMSIITVIAAAAVSYLLGALVLVAAIFLLLSSALELVTGIVGVKNCNDPTKAKPCIVLCGIIILLSLIGFILTICSGGFSVTGLISFILGLVIPGLYMWGAIKNMKQAEA